MFIKSTVDLVEIHNKPKLNSQAKYLKEINVFRQTSFLFVLTTCVIITIL